MTGTLQKTSLTWARSRLIKKGLEVGGKEFKKALNSRSASSARKAVYEEWADACLSAKKNAEDCDDGDLAAKCLAEHQRVLLVARKEFPTVRVSNQESSEDKSSSQGAIPKTPTWPDKKLAITEKPQATQSTQPADFVAPPRPDVLLRPQAQQSPEVVVQHVVGTNRVSREKQHIPHVDEIKLRDGSSAVQEAHVPGTAASTISCTAEPGVSKGNVHTSTSSDNPGGLTTRPSRTGLGAETASHDGFPPTAASLHSQPSGPGGLKRASKVALQDSAQVASQDLEPARKCAKDSTPTPPTQPDSRENPTKSVSMTRSLRDTDLHGDRNDKYGTTVTSQDAEARRSAARVDMIPRKHGGALHEPVPEAPMGLKPNIQSFGQHSLVAPGHSAHVAATSSQAAALQQVHPASSQGAHPAQPLAEAQPASHRDATSHPAPAQQAPPSDVPGIALQDRHKVIRSAEVAPPQPTVARSDVSERSQSHEPMNAQGQVKSTRWLAPTTSKGDDRNSRGERLCETETSVTLCGVKYQKIELIGKGGSCRVFKVCAPNKRLFALKRVNMRGMPEASQQGYREEVDLLRRLKGTHGVISMYSFEEFPRDHVLLMLLELGETDLQLLLQRKMEQWRKQGFTDPFSADPHFICCIWQDMLRVVQSVHAARVVHADLKPPNFMIVNGCLKLIDFGISKACGNNTTAIHREDPSGTLNYMAPEAVRNTGRVGRASDVWSLGCILYQIAYGKLPFSHVDCQVKRMRAILDETPKFPPISRSDVLDVLKRCLDPNPTTRATIADLLEHPYLKAAYGGEVTLQVMWEMHQAILRAPPHSLGPDDSMALFHALQRERNQGRTVDADALVQWHLADKSAHRAAEQQDTVPMDDTVMMPPPNLGRLPVVVAAAREPSLTGGSETLQSRQTAEASAQHGHPAGRQPLAEKCVSAGTAAWSGHGMTGIGEPHTAHSVATSARTQTQSENVGAKRMADSKGSLAPEPDNENRVVDNGARRDSSQSMARAQVEAAPVHPEAILEQKIRAIRSAHVHADEGYRKSLKPW